MKIGYPIELSIKFSDTEEYYNTLTNLSERQIEECGEALRKITEAFLEKSIKKQDPDFNVKDGFDYYSRSGERVFVESVEATVQWEYDELIYDSNECDDLVVYVDTDFYDVELDYDDGEYSRFGAGYAIDDFKYEKIKDFNSEEYTDIIRDQLPYLNKFVIDASVQLGEPDINDSVLEDLVEYELG